MTERERLIELIESEIDTVAANINASWLADYLLQNGVVVLLRDGDGFNEDLYCPYCGYILSDTENFHKE